MKNNEKQNQVITKIHKIKLNKGQLQGFIAGILIMAVLVSASLFFYISNNRGGNLGGIPVLQSNQYDIIENFDDEVLRASGRTLVFFNDSSIGFDHMVDIYNKIYENSGVKTKTFYVTKNTYGFIEQLGLSRYDLPVFAIFGNGKLLSSHKLNIEEVSVVKWLDPYNEKQPRIYRAFPSSAFDSVGNFFKNGYYVSELCLMPELTNINGFIKLSGNMTLTLKDHTILYSLLIDKFGGDNKTNFGLPNLDAQIPVAGLRYYMGSEKQYYPERDYDKNLISYVDGNIKYLEFSIDDINQDTLIGNIILAKNIDEERYKDLMLPCDGRSLSVKNNPVMADIFGKKFGGDGVSNFTLPDLSNVTSPIKGAKYYVLLRSLYPSSN